MANIIESFEYFDYRAPNSANLNDDNGDFSITVHNEDLITHPNKSLLVLRGKVTVMKEDKTVLDKLDFAKIEVCSAGWLNMFERIDFYIGDNKIDTVRKPGIVGLMKGLASFETDKQFCNAGWDYDVLDEQNTLKSNGYFHVMIPMSIVMGFFEDHKNYIYNMNQKLVIYKAADGVNNIFRVLDDAYKKAKISVDLRDVIFKMPHVKFTLEHTTRIRSEIAKNCKYELKYRRWFYNNIIPASGTDFTWDIPVSYSKTKYLLIAFQTGRINDISANNSTFDFCDLENCQVLLNNNVYYPHERMNLNIAEHKCGTLYFMYKHFKASYYTRDDDRLKPLLSYEEFLTRNPMIAIDCSHQPNVLKESLINLKIFFVWRKPLPANTIIHCVTIVDDKAIYSPLTNNVFHS